MVTSQRSTPLTRYVLVALALLGLVWLYFTGAFTPTPTPTFQPTESSTVSRAEMGKDWPLTVDEGRIFCSGTAILLRTNQGLYAVNGTARGQIATKGWKDVRDITLPASNVQPIIDRGLRVCR